MGGAGGEQRGAGAPPPPPAEVHGGGGLQNRWAGPEACACLGACERACARARAQYDDTGGEGVAHAEHPLH